MLRGVGYQNGIDVRIVVRLLATDTGTASKFRDLGACGFIPTFHARTRLHVHYHLWIWESVISCDVCTHTLSLEAAHPKMIAGS